MDVLSLVTNKYATFYRNQISALERRGINFTHVYPPKQSRGEPQEVSRNHFDYFRMYIDTLRKSGEDFDLVHANNGKTAPFALAQLNRPVVVSFWGSELMENYRWLSKRCAELADANIVMSHEMAQLLENDSFVIPHGVDFQTFEPLAQEEARPRIGWDSTSKHVLFPYHPSREIKNYPLASRVVESANERLDSTVELHAVSGVPHEQIPIYMNAADVLLLTSDREGSPNAVKEALACNTPVVATPVGDVPEQLSGVTNSTTGTDHSELVEAIVRVLLSEERSDGRQHVRDLSLEAMADRIKEVYESVLKQNSSLFSIHR